MLLNRRSLLKWCGTSALATIGPFSPVHAQKSPPKGPHNSNSGGGSTSSGSTSSGSTSAFYGNPNVNITAIDTSGGIVCSRTSGMTPCFVQVSASAIAAAGTNAPYEDLSYTWNFGDASGAETFTNPGVRGGTVNANTDQTGPEAGYVYRAPGTYTITLTIQGPTSSGYITTSVTRQITVTAFSTSVGYSEIYVDSAAPAGGTGTAYSPFNSIADINRFVASGTNKQVWIKRGSSWSGTTPISLGEPINGTGTIAGLRLAPYGTGASPIFNFTGNGTDSCLQMKNGVGGADGTPGPKSDIVISGLVLNSTESAGKSVVGFNFYNQTAVCHDIFIDNCTITATTDGGCSGVVWQSSFSPALLYNWGFWATNITGALPSAGTQGAFTLGQRWHMFVGGSISGGGGATPSQFLHHYYPIVQQHFLAAWINFGAGANRNFCINLDWDQIGSTLNFAEFALITECNASGTQRFHDASDADNAVTKVNWRNVVCQMNRIHDLTANGVVTFFDCISYTHRYNQVWNCNGGVYFQPMPGLNNLMVARFYGNKIYRTNGVDEILLMNDMTQPQTITDEAYQSTQLSCRQVAISFAAQAGAAKIDRNTWYCSNATTSVLQFEDKTTGKSFVDWQSVGFDRSGKVANPGWLDPANGKFN